MPQYRISDELLIETSMVLSEEDVAEIAKETSDGTFVAEKWNVQEIEHVATPPIETVTIPVTEYEALVEAANASASPAEALPLSTVAAIIPDPVV